MFLFKTEIMQINKNAETSLFLSHHNLIKARFSLPHNDLPPSELSPDPQPIKPLFLTTIPIFHPRKKHPSFSSFSSQQRLAQPTQTLKSFHHQVQFDNFKKTFSSEKKNENTTKKSRTYFINTKNKKLASPKSPKKLSILDVIEILENHQKNKDNFGKSVPESPQLKNYLDPSLDLRKFSIKKADQNLIEMTKGGKNRTKLSIIPINNPEFMQAPLSTFRNSAFAQFLQKSLKGNHENIQKSVYQAEYQEVREDITELKEKLYEKLNRKPKERIHDSIFKFSEKTMMALGAAKLNKMKEIYDQGKNPIDLRNYKEIGVPKLTFEELGLIKDNFARGKKERDWHLLEVLTKTLKFFHLVSKDVRQLILRNSELISFDMGEIIINETNKGQYAYIILKGGVNIRGSFQKNSQNMNMVLISLYDGDHFGDFSNEFGWNFTKKAKKGQLMINEPYVEACESSVCLRIEFKMWSGLLKNMMQRDWNEKMNVLKSVEVFKDEENGTLLALASQFQIKSYKIGEVLVRDGEEIEDFFIIVSGRCVILYRSNDDLENLSKNNENLHDEIIKTTKIHKNDEKTHKSAPIKPFFRKSSSLSSNLPDLLPEDLIPNRLFPQEGKNDVIGILHELDFFCERALFSDEEIKHKSLILCEDFNRAAKLTVASDREGTTVMRLERKAFLMLPIEIQSRIKVLFNESLEFDLINREKLGRELKNWELIKKGIRNKLCKKS